MYVWMHINIVNIIQIASRSVDVYAILCRYEHSKEAVHHVRLSIITVVHQISISSFISLISKSLCPLHAHCSRILWLWLFELWRLQQSLTLILVGDGKILTQQLCWMRTRGLEHYSLHYRAVQLYSEESDKCHSALSSRPNLRADCLGQLLWCLLEVAWSYWKGSHCNTGFCMAFAWAASPAWKSVQTLSCLCQHLVVCAILLSVLLVLSQLNSITQANTFNVGSSMSLETVVTAVSVEQSNPKDVHVWDLGFQFC